MSHRLPIKISCAILLFSGQLWAQITVSVSPAAACMLTSKQQQFQATVTGASDTTVTWYVDNVKGGYSSGGFINSSGLYTAPATANTHYVQATSNADNTTKAVVQVVVRSSAGIIMLPVSANVMALSSQSFAATTCGLTSGVTWSVDGVIGGSATAGTIDNNGVYTAPATAGTHTVKATSTADASKTATASVTVYAQITADFTSRTSSANPVPAGTFGTQLGFLFNGFYSNQQGMQYLTAAGLTTMRVDALLQTVYAGTSPDWSQVDSVLSNLQAAGVQPLVVMGYTPPALQPTPNSCDNYAAQPYHAVPTDIQQWATLAKAWVAHVDQKFPGYVRDYEIWNEPDNSPGLCVPDNSDASRLSAYLQMYAAAAPLMKQQAAADGITIRTGGPALTSSGTANEWIPALTTNAGTAPYVDFVTYHNYATSPLVEQSGSTWDNVGIPESLSFRTQDPGSGFTAIYRNMVNLVRKGSQPNAATTPVILGEYNTTASFTTDCCRNDRIYAPLFNALAVQDLLNAFKLGLPVPEHALYFAAQNWYPDKQGTIWFCLIGTIDTLMDCAYSASTAQPYPQYYAYALLLGSNYLGLGGGGFMVQSTPALAGAGIAVSAFYTAGNDAVVITNPTGADYSNVTVNLQNTGNLPVATMYLLNSANSTISVQALQGASTGNGFTTSIPIPHYSVVAVSLSASGPKGVLVGISPSSASVGVNQKQQFTATVSGATNPSVTWSVDNVPGGNSLVGTVSPSGLYMAPGATGQHTVTATSVQDPTRTASAQVSVTSPITVSVAPSSASIGFGQTQQFQATVNNSSNTGITWSVDGVAGGNTLAGTITADGMYTAPSAAGTHTITATSQADSTASGNAQVSVTAHLTVDPSTATVVVGATQAFRAVINGSTATSVTWSVDNVVGGTTSTGTISSSGTYTAPATPGQHTVTAVSQGQTASAQVAVIPQPTFSLSVSNTTVKLNAGSSAQVTLLLAPAGFVGRVSLACTGAPLSSTCTVSPNSTVLDGSNAASSTVSITTTARSLAGIESWGGWTTVLATFLVPLVIVMPAARFRTRATLRTLATVLCLMIMTSCGGGGGSSPPPQPPPGTPAGTYTLTITATAGQITRTTPITLHVN